MEQATGSLGRRAFSSKQRAFLEQRTVPRTQGQQGQQRLNSAVTATTAQQHSSSSLRNATLAGAMEGGVDKPPGEEGVAGENAEGIVKRSNATLNCQEKTEPPWSSQLFWKRTPRLVLQAAIKRARTG